MAVIRSNRIEGRSWINGPWHDADGVRAVCGARLPTRAGYSISHSPDDADGPRCTKCFPPADLFSLFDLFDHLDTAILETQR